MNLMHIVITFCSAFPAKQEIGNWFFVRFQYGTKFDISTIQIPVVSEYAV